MEFSEHPSNQVRPPTIERVTTGKTKRYMVAAALVGGGVTLGAVFSPVGLAGAQSSDEGTEATGAAQEADETDADSTDADSTGEDSTDADGVEEKADGRHRRGHGRFESLTDILGLSSDELREQFSEGLTVAEIAEEQGISSEDLVSALVAAVNQRIDEALAEERIDAEQAEERLANVEERIESFINREPGEGGRGDHGEGRRGRFANRGGHLSDAIESLGLTREDVQAGRADGKTLAEIAAEQGVSEQDLIDALVAEMTDAVDEALAEGKIDADRAEELKANIDERVAEKINRAPGENDGEGRRGRRGHHRHSHADADGETEGTSYSA